MGVYGTVLLKESGVYGTVLPKELGVYSTTISNEVGVYGTVLLKEVGVGTVLPTKSWEYTGPYGTFPHWYFYH